MRALACSVFLVTLLALGQAHACSCSGQGPASALTRPDQTWGVRLSERLLLGYGAFNAHGEYAAFSAKENDRTVEYALLAAYRFRRLELSGTFSYGARSATISDQSERSVGFGDTTVRARYEAASEPEPWQTAIYPGLAMLGSVRLPTAHASGLAPRGLGTVEFALGVVLERALSRSFRGGLVAEVAGRLPDTSLGVTRRLGPRASAELTLSYFATPDWVLSVLLGLRWEGNASLRQREQSGTAQRTTELGAALSFQPWSSPVRAGFAERYAPAVDQLGANTARYLTTEFWIGYVR